jgi:two-component system cell cycle sensor histidine kinase/response regulator CckA
VSRPDGAGDDIRPTVTEPPLAAFDDAPVAMAVLAGEGDSPATPVRVNRALAGLIGISQQEVTEHGFAPLLAPGEAAQLAAAATTVSRGDEPVVGLELGYRRPDGGPGRLVIGISPFGTGPAVLLQAADVTESRRAESALRRSEAMKAAVLATALDGIVTIDAGGRVLECNPAAEAMFGWTAAAAVGADFAELMLPERDRGWHRREVAAVAATGESRMLDQRVEIVGRRADGTEFPLELAVAATGAELPTYTAFLRDLTDRHRSEEVMARAAAIVDSSEDAILGKDLDGTITSWNAAAQRLYGYSADEAVGQRVHMLMPDPSEADRILARLAEGRRTQPYETRRRRRDGALIDVSVSVSPVLDASGSVIGAATIARDITDRKRAEADLHLSEQRYRTLVSQLPDAAVYVYDRDLRIVHAEGPLLNQLGKSPETVVGMTIWELVSEPRAEIFAEHFRALDGRGSAFEWEAGGGGIFDVDLVPLYDGDGEIAGAMALARDVSDRRRIERGLHFQAELLDRLDVAVIATDLEGRVTHWNRAAEQIWERSRSEALGRSIAELNPEYDLPDPGSLLERLAAGETQQSDFELTRSDGGKQSLLVTSSAVRDASGGVVGFVGVWVDVTSSRKAEVEKRALETRLHRSQRLDGIGRLAGGIAHDFNNLLAVILNYAELVMDELPGDDGQVSAYVGEIAEAAERAAALTRQLLVFGRREVVQPRALDVNAVLADMGKLIRRTIGEDLELRIVPADELSPVRADHSQIEQVLLNLALNARDAMPAGGALTIATADVVLDDAYAAQHAGVTPGRHVRITVADTGTGMSPEVREQALEPFFTTKPAGAGSGLGLAIVYGIVTEAGGHVELYSEDGRGTVVRILLPADPSAVADPVAEAGTRTPPARGETVLVVEDEPSLMALVARLLKDAGYRVMEAGTPDQAIELVATGEPDLLLTDVIMPGMSGGELAARLCADHPALRVLYMSGYTDDIVMRHGVQQGQIAFVEKPFNRSTLLQSVRDALDREAPDA